MTGVHSLSRMAAAGMLQFISRCSRRCGAIGATARLAGASAGLLIGRLLAGARDLIVPHGDDGGADCHKLDPRILVAELRFSIRNDGSDSDFGGPSCDVPLHSNQPTC